MSAPKTYPLGETLKALNALRTAAGLEPEEFPMEAFVGMISDEIDALRQQGKSDAEIVAVIQQSSSIQITPQELTENYATPQHRHQHQDQPL